MHGVTQADTYRQGYPSANRSLLDASSARMCVCVCVYVLGHNVSVRWRACGVLVLCPGWLLHVLHRACARSCHVALQVVCIGRSRVVDA